MICPRCNAVNPEGSKFCHQCGAPLVSAAAATPLPLAAPQASGPSPAAPPPHLVVHRHTSPALWVFVAGAALAFLVLLAGIGAGAYHVLKGGRAAPIGPAGVQPRAPGSSPTSPSAGPSGPTAPPQAPPPQPAVPGPTSPAAPAAPTPPAGPTPPTVTPQPPSPAPGPTQPPPTPPGPTSPTGPVQHPSGSPQVPGQPPQPAGPQPPSPASPLPPQPPATAEMQAYRDPGGAFSIEYPKTWKVQRGSNGYTVFYQDDPEEGTLFGVFPKLVLNGQATAAQILDALKRDVRQRYPDFEVKRQEIKPAEGGELALVDARWTNGRNERMATALMLWVNTPENRGSEVLLVNIQAPEVAFVAVEPTFQHMFKTFIDSLGRQAAR